MPRIDVEQDGRWVLAYLIQREDETGFRSSHARVNFDAFPPPLGEDYDQLGGAVTWLENHPRRPYTSTGTPPPQPASSSSG